MRIIKKKFSYKPYLICFFPPGVSLPSLINSIVRVNIMFASEQQGASGGKESNTDISPSPSPLPPYILPICARYSPTICTFYPQGKKNPALAGWPLSYWVGCFISLPPYCSCPRPPVCGRSFRRSLSSCAV